MINYNKKSTFSSFLPGISGIEGIPIWCFYVNRAQGVVSFGVQDKDHAIMEFYPAHQAYQNVSRTGFRTFIKIDDTVVEPFSNPDIEHEMNVGMNKLQIQERAHNLTTEVTYFTLPNEKVGALVRKLTITNTTSEHIEMQLIDGMPSIIPYGVGIASMKMMGQTVKAWMQVEDVETKVPYFKVRASMEDTATVTEVSEGNFSVGCYEDGTKLLPIVDPEIVFGYDTSLSRAIEFENNDIEALLDRTQVIQNQLPSSFYGSRVHLAAGQSFTMYQVIGQATNKNRLNKFLEQQLSSDYFTRKENEAMELTNELTKPIETKTGNETFDKYIKSSYMDNILRGGTPIMLGNKNVFYIYSRKHGDIERDYNFFSVLPEYYSQGNGNFRDVNQNRRCDNLFHKHLGTQNIHTFYDCIQLDGYNPLSIEQLTYTLSKTQINKFEQRYNIKLSEKPFTPGKLLMYLEDSGFELDNAQEILCEIMDQSSQQLNAKFGEGYWSDHWTYNLDLIEAYLQVYPDKEEELLYNEPFNYFLSNVMVNPRHKRYEMTKNGLRQYHALDENNRQTSSDGLARNESGDIIVTTLIEKLVLLCTTKYATLDPYGMGIEMEGGKPGWYDALNGLPGLFGSSMAETYELARNMEYTISVLERFNRPVNLFAELSKFINELAQATDLCLNLIYNQQLVFKFWDLINIAKEKYREDTFEGIHGDMIIWDSKSLVNILKQWLDVVYYGINKASEYNICPTYFAYDAIVDENDKPISFTVINMPLFLEGPSRYLKLLNYSHLWENVHNAVKSCDLYDEKLKMYKVNASLKDASFEIGRAKSFTPGWLENESIWLHMEYKYLLELLKTGQYTEFFSAFKDAAVPFLDEEVYGRSVLENSSFIASSANPNPSYHGKGFVARLSGSTAEMISIWKSMMFGDSLFVMKDDKLTLNLAPAIAAYLLNEEKQIVTTLLGNIKLIYNFDKVQDYTPDNSYIKSCTFKYHGGDEVEYMLGQPANDVRDGKVDTIIVNMTAY
ncbi:MAG: hypothetical protein ATN33_05540 [Epulopiscium sp. Nele67-Bin001]|nr:MAG: hypothetical protein ATN33_05540 [Epulopiscium sp. Nele67-Bin001]